VVELLGRLLGRRVALDADPGLGPGAAVDTGSDEKGGEAGRITMTAGAEPIGELVAWGSPLNDLERDTLEHGAIVLTAELLRERSAREAEWRLQGELLDELIQAGDPPPENLRLRANHAGVDLRRPRQVVVFESDEGTDRLLPKVRALVARHREGGPSLAFQRGDRVVAAILPAAERSRFARELAGLGPRVRGGVSNPTLDLATGFRVAQACAKIAAGDSQGPAVVSADSLAPYSLLFESPDSPGQAEGFVRESLGGLADFDRTSRMPLMTSVRCYVEASGHLQTAAERAFVHPTTLAYRLNTAGEHITGDLADVDVRYQLRLAFGVLRVLESLDRDPLRQTV
jgi:DNA-binding PucR family transcriptional regulator